jgi:hypothetical protein
MPTTPARARRWIKSGKATSFWKGGFFCVRLNVEPSARVQQPIAVGIDPGSKREGIVMAGASHHILQPQRGSVTILLVRWSWCVVVHSLERERLIKYNALDKEAHDG